MVTSSVNVTLLTFEDIPGGSIQYWRAEMPTTYKGFNFDATSLWVDAVDSQYNFGAHSGEFALLASVGSSIITESGGLDSLFGSISGYNNGVLVWDIATSLNGSYEYYAAQLGLIDELRMDLGRYFLVDDIALNEVSAVPVPAAWLFGSALLGFFGFSRKKANA